MELSRIVIGSLLLLAALPSTSNYKLNSYGFGAGGTAGSSTSNYRLEGTAGQLSGQTASTSTAGVKPGYIQTQQANVPAAPTLTNPSNYYDKLKLVLNTSSNPTDALYAIAISSDNFAADTRYVKSDHSIGTVLTTGDYQTYTTWGGASGFNIIGLASNTTYTVKAKATQGRFTESDFGPTAQAATVGQQLSFSLSTNTESLGTLTSGTVINSPTNVTASIATNANAGGNVYITSINGGLKSNFANFTIASVSGDLSSLTSGFGAQGLTATQTSGGPLSIVTPYNVSGQNVGIIDTSLRNIFHATAPLVGGQGTLMIKAKAGTVTPAATDYTETLTIIGAAIF